MGDTWDLDGGGWVLVWKMAYMETETINQSNRDHFHYYSQDHVPCTGEASQAHCNIPNKGGLGSQYALVASHNEKIVYAYRGDVDPDTIDSQWEGAALNRHNPVKMMDLCRNDNGIAPEPFANEG